MKIKRGDNSSLNAKIIVVAVYPLLLSAPTWCNDEKRKQEKKKK
jgi:hypothetical protein